MAYQKKYATKEERSLALSRAGKKGADKVKENGTHRGGRPKGSRNKNSPSIAEPSRSILVRDSAYQVFVRCAGSMNTPMISFMSLVAENLKKRNPQLFNLRNAVQV
jgi:hypothetical protein